MTHQERGGWVGFGGKALRVQPGHQVMRIHSPTTHKAVNRNVLFVELPSEVVAPSISETDNIYEQDHVGIPSLHDGLEHDDMVRDVRD